MGRVKNETLTIRLSEWEKRFLQESAANCGLNITQYITYNLIYKMQEKNKKSDEEYDF